jgi:hypothetical protein
MTPNMKVKPVATLLRTHRTPACFAHGFAMLAQSTFDALRRLPRC